MNRLRDTLFLIVTCLLLQSIAVADALPAAVPDGGGVSWPIVGLVLIGAALIFGLYWLHTNKPAQYKEVEDGTTALVKSAHELLHKALDKIHPNHPTSTVINPPPPAA